MLYNFNFETFKSNLNQNKFEANPIWKMAKKHENFDNVITCIEKVMNQIDIAEKSNSPIALIYEIPRILTDQQNLLEMAEDACRGDGAFQSDFTEKCWTKRMLLVWECISITTVK